MIRPSALTLAQYCGHSSRLAEQYPEGSEATEHGTEIHRQIAEALINGTEPADPGAQAAVSYVHSLGLEVVGVELPVSLIDPETGEKITEGTTDLVLGGEEFVCIVDWKTGRPENVIAAEESLQLHAYGLAAAQAYGVDRYVARVGHVVDGKFWPGDAVDVQGAYQWTYLERIKAAASRPDEAITGGHCDSCFQRKHCYAWSLPAHQGESAIAPYTKGQGITPANAAQAVQVYEAFKDAVKIMKAKLEDYVRDCGPIVDGDWTYRYQQRNGKRRGPTVEECEEMGRLDLIKQGEPYEFLAWTKAKAKRKGKAA